MKTFLISDTHFGHVNILTFKNKDGSFLRPFSSLEEMNETIISNWNSVVSNEDKVYHLGDVCFTKKWLDLILPRLNGTKILIKGNHDVLKLTQYQQYFKDVRAYHKLDKFILSHIPIHPDSLSRWRANIHGHTHSNSIQEHIPGLGLQDDQRYFNVSVENINYTPLNFEYIRSLYT